MFFGTFQNSIDDKGRCMIPSKFRNELGETCMLVMGADKCLYIYTVEAYKRFLDEHLLNRPFEDKSARKLKRFYAANSRDCDIDKQGRINLPQKFINFAGIVKETVTLGNIEHVEIWSKERYESEMDSESIDPDALFADMLKYVDGA
ncbi:MAG: division/cell wall cluster transcriptional repressor MraZ [Clostridiales Family XIII bacterium]|nr:division/cell wall cluster transcriptional repressor MraZ [Clostridiales Family XIII bacterium]